MWKSLVVALLFIPSVAIADSPVKSDDIVKFFREQAELKKADEAKGEQPKTRAVFVQPSGFDKTESAPTNKNASAQSAAYNLLVTFDINSDRLTSEAKRNLSQFADALKTPDLSAMEFSVEGHTDGLGSKTYNQSLSARRAEAVVQFLSNRGVAKQRLKPKGFGESRPIKSDPNHPGNRRVETRALF